MIANLMFAFMILNVAIIVGAKHFKAILPHQSEIAVCADTEDNCDSLKFLCNDTRYNDSMAKRCPVTCGACPPCADKADYCSQMAEECGEPDFQDSLYEDCPKTCGLCEVAGWAYFSGSDSWYLMKFKSTSWNASEAFCISVGGQLASIHSADENIFVSNLMGSTWTWIGLRGKKSGTLNWTDQSAVNYTNFYVNADSSGYGFIRGSDGEWDLNPAEVTHHFVCKKPNRNN